MNPAGTFAAGWTDLAGALRRHWLWRALARQDLKRRYARTVIGPLWAVLSLALTAGAIAVLFAGPLGAATPAYPVYVVTGLALWQFVLSTLGEAPTMFVAAAETIRTTALPLSVHPLRLVWRNLAVLLMQAPLVAGAMLVSRVPPTPGLLLLGPALLVGAAAALGAILLLATLGARFRDAQPIVGSGLQLLFFVTPIFWTPAVLPDDRAWLVHLNPLGAFIDIVRAPLLGTPASATSWAIAGGLAALLLAAGLIVFGRCRPQLAYWA